VRRNAEDDALPILAFPMIFLGGKYPCSSLKTPHGYLQPRKITEKRPIGSPSYVYAALRDVLLRTVDERL